MILSVVLGVVLLWGDILGVVLLWSDILLGGVVLGMVLGMILGVILGVILSVVLSNVFSVILGDILGVVLHGVILGVVLSGMILGMVLSGMVLGVVFLWSDVLLWGDVLLGVVLSHGEVFGAFSIEFIEEFVFFFLLGSLLEPASDFAEESSLVGLVMGSVLNEVGLVALRLVADD